MTAPRYSSGRITTDDGLKLHYRDYNPGTDSLPVLCLHGLTRNGRDFETLADWLAPARRLIAPDMRGRGESDYDKNWRNYHPYRYVADTFSLLDALELERVIVVGTSLGGWMSAIIANERPAALAGVVLNDIGPELDPRGLARIAATVGNLPAVSSWDQAVAQTRQNYELALPNLPDATWRWYAANTYRETGGGALDLNFDRNIGVASRAGIAGLRGDPWKLFDALEPIPTLVLHGELSDILNHDIVARMHARLPRLQSVTIPDRGHVPLLDEPESVDAIRSFLDHVDAIEAGRT